MLKERFKEVHGPVTQMVPVSDARYAKESNLRKAKCGQHMYEAVLGVRSQVSMRAINSPPSGQIRKRKMAMGIRQSCVSMEGLKAQ